MSDLVELLEMRVSRLERIVAAIGGSQGAATLASDSLIYAMSDPRLVLFGAYELEVDPARGGKMFRWVGGSRGLVQMVFPHGRGCAQQVRLWVLPATGVDLSLIRIIVDETKIAPQLTPDSGGALTMNFRLPAAFGYQTEIQMQDVPVINPKDHGSSDERLLSFALYEAQFTAALDD